jgi:mono/diheme cytochrome c family protein
MRRTSRILAFATILFAMILAGVPTNGQEPGANREASKLKNPVAPTPKSVAAGERLFKVYCRLCHGSTGKGDGPQAPKGTHPPDLTDEKWDRGSTDGEIFAVIRDGAGPKFDMKGYRSKLTPEEMWSLVNYLRSIGPRTSH